VRRFVVRHVASGVSKDCVAFIFRVKQSAERHSNIKLLDVTKSQNGYRLVLCDVEIIMSGGGLRKEVNGKVRRKERVEAYLLAGKKLEYFGYKGW